MTNCLTLAIPVLIRQMMIALNRQLLGANCGKPACSPPASCKGVRCCCLGAPASAMRHEPARQHGKELHMTHGRVNPQYRLKIKASRAGQCLLQPAGTRTGRGRAETRRRDTGQGRRVSGRHREAYRPFTQGQIHRAHTDRSRTHLVGKQRPMQPEGFDALYDDMLAHMKGATISCRTCWRCRPAHRLDVRM